MIKKIYLTRVLEGTSRLVVKLILEGINCFDQYAVILKQPSIRKKIWKYLNNLQLHLGYIGSETDQVKSLEPITLSPFVLP